jgi:hypothetical protein
MDNLGNLGIKSPPIIIKPVISVPSSAPVAQKPEASFVPMGAGDSETFDPQVTEQQRLQNVRRASQQVADVFVVSDRTFTIFKDVSGQYVTRFTSLRDGKVTYIPEPNLFRIGGESDKVTVNIKA